MAFRSGFPVRQHRMKLWPSPVPVISEPIHPQDNCPFFTLLPAEIRLKIYEYALTASDDPDKPFKEFHYHYRPAYKFAPRYDFRLIQTCKRIFFETRLMPITLNEVVLYLYRGPKSWQPCFSLIDWTQRYASLNEEQRSAVGTVHYFAQQFYLEDPKEWTFAHVDTRRRVIARTFVLTIRHSDWWSWESPPNSNDQLGICPWRPGRTSWQEMEAEPLDGPVDESLWKAGWGSRFQQVVGLEVLKMELETTQAKRRQLERVVERAKHWRFPLADDHELVWTGKIQESSWEGRKRLVDDVGSLSRPLRHVNDGSPVLPPTMQSYMVMHMTWKRVRKGTVFA